MAIYKVPQDVEADDKLIGPFTFRQFIYLVIVSLSIALAWGLGTVMLPLAVLPLPVIIFFGALALPLRKDQPMEIFMAAMVSFYLKPRRRLWDPDGIDSLIEITVPKIEEVQLTKNLSKNEAERRLNYLAEIADSRGWSVRNPSGVQVPNVSINSDVYFEAQQVKDVQDIDSFTMQMLDNKLNQSAARLHQEMIDIAKGKAAPIIPNTPITPITSFSNQPNNIEFNPYPTSIHQTVIQPLSEQRAHKPTPTTSEKSVSADIINLANNTSLSIETIAREANRIREKRESSEEVIISLR